VPNLLFKTIFFLSPLLFSNLGFANSPAQFQQFDIDGEKINVQLCVPKISGKAPAVIYHHGSRYAGGVGGAPDETCQSLADLGYVGIVPNRPDLRSREEVIRFIKATILFSKGLASVDGNQIAAIGYSQGGVMAYLTATTYQDLRAAVILAAGAGPRGGSQGADQVHAPILIMVAENDIGSATSMGRNFRAETQQLFDGLKRHQKDVELIVLPSTERGCPNFCVNGVKGHC
jgi:dienelactone hydrolase